jgi:sugar lactone lactonase YvrE
VEVVLAQVRVWCALVKETLMPELHTLLTGRGLVESPRWHDGRLWFADWSTHEIIAVDQTGTSEIIALVPSAPCCFDWLPDGRLLIVSGREGQLLRREADGSLVTHADLTTLAAPPWNDIVVDGRGNAYIGCTGFDFPGGAFAPGLLALVTPDGTVRQVADGVAFPNGVAVTRDNATLLLAESYANCLTAFDIGADGSLANRRVWAPLEGFPDGICLDTEGAVWYGDVPNQCCVRVREGGEVLQRLALDRGCFACVLGGTERRTLFLLAAAWGGAESLGDGHRTGRVLKVEVPVAGAGWP